MTKSPYALFPPTAARARDRSDRRLRSRSRPRSRPQHTSLPPSKIPSKIASRRRVCDRDPVEDPVEDRVPLKIMDQRHYGFAHYSNSQASQGGFVGVSDEHPISSEQSPISEQPRTESSTVRRPVRSASFSVAEDLMLISSWINISTDPVSGTDQRRESFWKHIYDFYYENKNFVSERTQNSLAHRWSIIQLNVSKFQACYAAIEERRQSGLNEQDKIQQAKELYCSLQKVGSFNFEHFWNELRYQPKWMEDSAEKFSKKKYKTHASASPGSSSRATAWYDYVSP